MGNNLIYNILPMLLLYCFGEGWAMGCNIFIRSGFSNPFYTFIMLLRSVWYRDSDVGSRTEKITTVITAVKYITTYRNPTDNLLPGTIYSISLNNILRANTCAKEINKQICHYTRYILYYKLIRYVSARPRLI